MIRKPFKYSYNNAVSVIIGINVLMFLLTSLIKNTDIFFGLVPAAVLNSKTYWQFFTYQFVHGSFFHLFFNMLALFFFGTPIEKKAGTNEFVLYYLTAGTLSGVFSFAVYVMTGEYLTVLIGASGAIFAVLLLYAVLYPRSVIFLWGILPIPAPLLILGYGIVELIGIFSSYDGVAHLTHFIGLVIGWLYILIRFGVNPLKIWNSSMR